MLSLAHRQLAAQAEFWLGNLGLPFAKPSKKTGSSRKPGQFNAINPMDRAQGKWKKQASKVSFLSTQPLAQLPSGPASSFF